MIDKREILDILKETVKEFPYLKSYKFIGVIGSFIKKNKTAEDLDIVTIGGKKHALFNNLLKKKLKKIGIKVFFFKTIKHKPTVSKHILLIHDLNYKTPKAMIKREWKSLIKEVKDNSETFYGSKKYIPNIKKITRRDLMYPLFKWARQINSKKRLENFYTYIEHMKIKLIRLYKTTNIEKVLNDLLKLRNKGSYKYQIKEIRKILNC